MSNPFPPGTMAHDEYEKLDAGQKTEVDRIVAGGQGDVKTSPGGGLSTIAERHIVNNLVGGSGSLVPSEAAGTATAGTPIDAMVGANGEVAPASGVSGGQVFGGLAALHGGYTAFNDLQHGGSGRAGFTEAGAGIGNILLPGVGGVVGGAFGNIMGYGLQGHGIKNHIALAATMPPLEIARLMGFNLSHKTTKQYEQERFEGLKKSDVQNVDKVFEANHGGPDAWTEGQFKGKKWNFEDATTLAKADPTQFRHVFGNYDAFGKDWSGYTPDQQNSIVSQLISSGLYKSDHGDIIITDKDKANQIRDSVLKGPGSASLASIKPGDNIPVTGTPTDAAQLQASLQAANAAQANAVASDSKNAVIQNIINKARIDPTANLKQQDYGVSALAKNNASLSDLFKNRQVIYG